MVDMAHFAGLVAGGAHPSPFPHAHVVTTTTHKTLRGPRGGMILTDDEALAKKINSAVFPGLQGGPLMHVIAAKAVAFGEALRPEFRAYAKAIVSNARALAAELREQGLDLVTGGTDNHLLLVDLRPKRLTGKAAEGALNRAHLTCNKNAIPFDPEKPMVTSGVRLGTPAATTRGFGEAEFREVGRLIGEVLDGLARANDGAEGNTAVEVLGQGARSGAVRALPDLPELETEGRETGMRCPYCGRDDTQVKDSRPAEEGAAIRRRRSCPGCQSRFTTFERVQLRELTVLKTDGRRVPFDRDKLSRSIHIALRKRPVDEDRVERIVNGIQRRLETEADAEVTSRQIGEIVMEIPARRGPGGLCPLRQRLPQFRRGEGLPRLPGRAGAGLTVALAVTLLDQGGDAAASPRASAPAPPTTTLVLCHC